MNYPFNDEYLQYDKKTHKYYLTEKYLLQELGINLSLVLNEAGDANPSTLPLRFLKKISSSVYNWLYEDCWSRDWLEYCLAVLPSLRNRITEMLGAQVLYVLNNGFVEDYAGINFAKGTIMDIHAIRGRAKISEETEQIANQTVPELGYSLKYLGRMPAVQRIYVTRITDMITALRGLGHNQFETAHWYKEPGRNKYKSIKIEIVNERERQYSTLIQNLVTTNDSTVLKTNYAYNYEVKQEIYYRGQWYIITAVGSKNLEVSPQSMALLKPQLNAQYFLELTRID